VVGAMFIFTARNQTRNSAVLTRNFYGVLNVRELNPDQPDWRAYSMFHGRISHGYQFQSEAKRRLPTGYYGLTSGIGMAWVGLQTHLSSGTNPQHLRVGIVGLGIGTLASYGNPEDYIRFYEINPEVTRIAHDARYFTYLKDCRAGLEVIPGDARLSMESELKSRQPQDFNLLAIDAFSGDAIPVHLLTQEAFQIYLQQVKADGIIAVHITNTYFDLRPVLQKVAEHFNLRYALLHTEGDGAITSYSDWVLLSRGPTIVDSLRASTGNLGGTLKPELALWTDDYSNLVSVLRK
jgi:spermidine synthase